MGTMHIVLVSSQTMPVSCLLNCVLWTQLLCHSTGVYGPIVVLALSIIGPSATLHDIRIQECTHFP
jgi:hypothetical protein